MTTTKKELALAMTAKGFDALDASKAIDAALEAIGVSLKAGNRVEIRGFGVFETKVRKASVSGLNGQVIPAKQVVKFKPGKELAQAVAIA